METCVVEGARHWTEVSGQVPLHGRSTCPLDRRLSEPQSRPGRCGKEKVLPYRESNPSHLAITNRHTDSATPVHRNWIFKVYILFRWKSVNNECASCSHRHNSIGGRSLWMLRAENGCELYEKSLYLLPSLNPPFLLYVFFCDKFQTGTEIFVNASQTSFTSVLLLTRQNEAAA